MLTSDICGKFGCHGDCCCHASAVCCLRLLLCGEMLTFPQVEAKEDTDVVLFFFFSPTYQAWSILRGMPG